uniref:DUF1985 domain-containing protein n=1 Tax=Brassica oleracea var. oleracea TaxID=109376 RepID=A0A0D3A9Q5_BRAOL
MELERFENYPWGRVAVKVLMDSVKGIDISGCYTINGFAQALQPAVVSPTKKKVVKEDSPRSRKKARKEASEEASEEAAAVASEEAAVEASEEVHTTVGGLTKEDIKSMFKDIVDAKREGFGTCLKEIKYLSERVEAVEKKVGITTKRKGTSAQNTTPPPKPTLEPGKENARYLEKRDAALALCRAKSDRTRKLAASQQSPYTTNSTAKHIDAWISVLRKRYDANPQHFKSERMCFLDHFFAQKWRFNYKDFKDSEPDQNSLGRRLP